MPGISDHDTMIYANISVKPYRQPPAKRNIILWKHADMDKIRDRADQLSHRITAQYSTQTPINTLWQEFKLGVDNILKSLPSKMTSSRFNQPWVNRTPGTGPSNEMPAASREPITRPGTLVPRVTGLALNAYRNSSG